jgi:FixJ family two-component response regulator
MSALIHIVEDDEALRQALARLLVASGYEVAAYESAEAFLCKTLGARPGCILLDVNMPGLTGMQLQEHLRRIGCPLPIVFLTGNGDIAMSVRAIKAGAEDFLSKPIGRAELIEAIERATRRFETEYAGHAELAELRRRIALLTAREREVYMLVVQGLLNKQIAYELGNTERTVKAHRASITEKLQARSVAELVQIGNRLGLVKSRHCV